MPGNPVGATSIGADGLHGGKNIYVPTQTTGQLWPKK